MSHGPEILVDSHHGIFMIQVFAERYNLVGNFSNYEDIKENLDYLSKEDNIHNEDYCDRIDELLNNAELINGDGIKGYLAFNEDLYFIPEDFDTEDFFI